MLFFFLKQFHFLLVLDQTMFKIWFLGFCCLVGFGKVADVEMDVYGGKKVGETVILNMIELLMMELIKLDGISAEGDVKLQRRMQV